MRRAAQAARILLGECGAHQKKNVEAAEPP